MLLGFLHKDAIDSVAITFTFHAGLCTFRFFSFSMISTSVRAAKWKTQGASDDANAFSSVFGSVISTPVSRLKLINENSCFRVSTTCVPRSPDKPVPRIFMSWSDIAARNILYIRLILHVSTSFHFLCTTSPYR